MYSIVMLVAMSGAPEMPSFGGRGGNGCGGYSCGGGYACGGGSGGRLFGGGRRRGGCGGGWGNGCGGYACNGGSGYGCGGYSYGGGSGCTGYVASSACGCCGTMAGTGYAHGGMVMIATPAAAPATVLVNLPADAKLTFDGAATTSTTASRRFTTPALPTGSDMSYTLTAEIVREGKTLKATQVVSVRAGQTTDVNLTDAQFTNAVVRN